MGGEVIRLISMHPRLELEMACGHSTVGKKLSEVRPGLFWDKVIEDTDPAEIAKRCDAAFLTLPHGTSAALVEELVRLGVLVYDLGSDFRLKDPADVQRFYKRDAAPQQLLDIAEYRIPELTGGPRRDAKLVACPGCFATAMALGLAPLQGLTNEAQVFGVTGSSGSGIKPAPGVHHSLRSTSFTAYKPLSHQHIGEVSQVLAERGYTPQIDFIPHSLPAVRGIHLTILVEADVDAVKARFNELYADKELISLHDGPIPLGMTIGSLRVAFGFASQGGKTVIFAVIDNLLKGGSGQAIQNFNLQQGWPETEGLPLTGMWP
jgi:N-acetyl-gamma-glutamyl-phosphate reductase